MDSSSDGSFAWTDASNDTIDSVSIEQEKMNKSHSEDESVSGKIYKKKLQKQLFAQSEHMLEAEQEEPLAQSQSKRKWSGNPSESDEGKSPRKKKIKREPESDLDVSTLKNKNNGYKHSESDDSHDESYLNLKVKDEQHFLTPHSKSKRSRDKSFSNTDLLNESSPLPPKKLKKNSKDHLISENLPEDDALSQLVQEESKFNEEILKKKKKKSKKRKDSTTLDETKPLNSDVEESRVSDETGTPSSPCDNHAHIPNKSTKQKKSVENGTNEEVLGTHQYLNESAKRKPRISERIQFEEECSDLETSQFQNGESKKSVKLKKFIKENSHLKPSTCTLEKSDASITADDEIWIIRCPKDVNVHTFKGKDVSLEGKCKLKLNGQSYDGTIDCEAGNMSILSMEQSDFVIKSLSVKGFLNLRKRIPKTHVQDDLALNNNQVNFIPLPETKSRHPFFGSNYKKAIKLSASVTERLNTTSPNKYKKKKPQNKGYQNSEQENDQYSVTQPKAEHNPDVSSKDVLDMGGQEQAGTRKKKSKGEDVAPIKKKKKSKHYLESAEAWDSEKAIEENLFNF